MSPQETKIEFELDIKNSGLEPTTISKIEFKSEVDELEECEMKNRRWAENNMHHSEFNPIRVEKNDRKNVSIHTYQNTFIGDDLDNIEGELTFKTTHENVNKEIEIKRTDS